MQGSAGAEALVLWRLISLVLEDRLNRLSWRRNLGDLLEALIALWLIVVGKGLIGLMEIGRLIVDRLSWLNLIGWRTVFGRIICRLADERLVGDFRIEIVVI